MNQQLKDDLKNGETAKLLADIRKQFRGGDATPAEPEPARENGAEGFSMAEHHSQMDTLMGEVLARYDTLPYDPVPSPRPVIGPAILFLKKIFLRALRPFFVMTLHYQIEFNQNVADELHLMHRLLKYLVRDSATLFKELESLRLQCAGLSSENLKQREELETLKKGSKG